MVNSFWAIHKRTYYLFNRTRSAFIKAYYQESMFNTSLTRTKETISLENMLKITQKPELIKHLKAHLKSEEEKWFWENANENLRQTLVYAFFLREVKNHQKIPNIETEDWTKNRLFLRKYEELMQVARWRKIGEPTSMIEGMIRTQGKHFRNLRFGHIHLTLDHLENKPVWGIHWDSSTIKSLDAREILTHWLEDDMPS